MKLAKIITIIDKIKDRLYTLLSMVPDYFSYKLYQPKQPSGKYIIFTGMYMHARIARMAKWIARTSDYKCILAVQKSVYTPELSNHSFEKTLLYRNKWHLFKLLKPYQSKEAILHCFGPPHQAAYEVIKKNNSKSFKERQKVFFDYQDLMITNFGLDAPFAYMRADLKREEYILKNVDGIINHSLELQTAKKYFGKIEPKKLFFPLYVDNDQFINKQVKESNEIHLVYAGGVHSMLQDSDYFGGQQFHWLIEKLEKQKIHLHIYPTPASRKDHLVDYVKMDKELKYFHLHKPISQDQLIKELNQYDYGIIPFFHRTNKRLNDKRYYSTALKLFNFYEAGIPVIVGEDTLFQNYMGRRFGGVISAKYEDFDDLSSLLEKKEYKILVDSIQMKRERLSLKNKTAELLSFYS